MGFDECYQLGSVIRTHGLNGDVQFFLDVDDPTFYRNLESVFIDINGKLVPFFIESIQINDKHSLVSLEDVDDLDSANQLVGKDLYLPANILPDLPEGQFYYHDLVGLEVFDQDQLIGTVKEVFQIPNNHLMGVDHHGKEVLIPLKDGIIKHVYLKEKKIIAQLPEGLLDVYLSE